MEQLTNLTFAILDIVTALPAPRINVQEARIKASTIRKPAVRNAKSASEMLLAPDAVCLANAIPEFAPQLHRVVQFEGVHVVSGR